MGEVLWLSGADVEKTGVCRLEETVKIVEEAFGRFDRGEAFLVPETALHLTSDGQDQACYALPAYVGGELPVCGVKWTAHGPAAGPEESRIHAAVMLNEAEGGKPLAILNGTGIGAARTGAVTALALRHLAPKQVKKVALCGAGGQAERQLQAVLLALPQAEEIAIWSRGNERNKRLAQRFQADVRPLPSGVRPLLRPVGRLEEAVDGADVIIAATSAAAPYLTPECVRSASLYCHIGFHEISREAVDAFSYIVADTWEEAKHVSGQSLFRYYREGSLDEARVTGTLGAVISGRLSVPRGTPDKKVFFDSFGLPVFDVSVAREAYRRGRAADLGMRLPW